MAEKYVRKLQKFFMEYREKSGEIKQYQIENRDTGSDGLDTVELPFHLNNFQPDEITMRFYHDDAHMHLENDFEFIKYLLLEDTGEAETNKEFERRKNSNVFLKNLPAGYFSFAAEEAKFPSMSYGDITEKQMFGYPAISASDLYSEEKGVWGMSGFRVFELCLDENFSTENHADRKQYVSLYWYQIDSTDIAPLFEEEVRFDKKRNCYIAYINTNQLQKAIEEYGIESAHPFFEGRFEIHDIYRDCGKVHTFPLRICVHDTRVIEGSCRDKQLIGSGLVSIDFGTSSTCAAIKGELKPQLFTLSGGGKRDVGEGDNPYENPTNLMIYRWDELYRQWQAKNPNPPFVMTKLQETVDETDVDYDSGYTVEDVFADVDATDGKRKMGAILTQLKMLPYQIAHHKEIKLLPYWDNQRGPITMVDDLQDYGDKKFNPIAFYGYLLSRAINNPANGKIYTRYQITYPVKFDKELREKIRAALEYGIRRALPRYIEKGKNRRGKDIVTVTMDYSEPIACIGAIVGQQLKISEEDGRAKVFAIYDLGGGTMDFSFGLFRNARDEDDEDGDNTIEILGVGGDDKVGGEKLIHKLAYKIYRDNRDLMEEHRIKFVLPENTLKPEGFDGLLGNDEIAEANLNIMKENLARKLFKSADPVDNNLTAIFPDEPADKVPDTSHYKLTLRDEDGEDADLELEITQVDDTLEEDIQKTIAAFQDEMEKCFSANREALQKAGAKADKSDLTIFLSGNASKQRFVEPLLQEAFPGYTITRIGEGLNKDGQSAEYNVNEKTAVAFGQLRLGEYCVDTSAITQSDDIPPFAYNVGYLDSGSNKFITVLEKNDVEHRWHRANRLDSATLQAHLYFTSSAVGEDAAEQDILQSLTPCLEDFVEDKKKKTLYLRVYEEDKIEFRLGSRSEAPSDDETPDPDMTISLDGSGRVGR